MLILSQDGSIAVKFSDDCAIYCTKNGANTNVNIAKRDTAFAIGVYSTEERAIKAIRMIVDWYVARGTNTLISDGSEIFIDSGLIFMMPDDEEVNCNDKEN